MDGNRSNSIDVSAMEDSLLTGDNVPNLVGVASCENETVVTEPMEVIPLERG
jgi:hypothetical protein